MALSTKLKGYMQKLSTSHITKKWQRRWFVLHNTTSDGVVRIEYYDDEAGEMAGANKRTILLKGFGDCRQVTGDKSHPYVFEITSQIGLHVFCCDLWDEMEGWMEGIRAAIADDQSRGTSRSVAARPSPTDLPQPEPSTLLISQMDLPPLKGAAAAPKMVQTKGAPTTFGAADPPRSKGGTMAPSPPKPVLELGKSQPQLHAKQDPQSATSTITSPAQFTVTLKANKDSKRLGLTGTYTLEVTPILVRLFEIGNTMPIVGWSYHELRSFTLSKGCVELECGRAAGTSAGKFVIVTREAKEVLRVMQHYIERQLIGSGRGSAGGGQDKAQPDELCVPLTPKCSAESPPSLKKSRPDFKQVVENDYATNQDVQSLMKSSEPAEANHREPSLIKNTSRDALLSDMDTTESSEALQPAVEAAGPKDTSRGISDVAATPAIPAVAGLTSKLITDNGGVGYTPATPVGATSYTPATPVGATGYTPATPVGATGYTPATPVGVTSYTPATPVGATGYTPATPVGATGYTPATPVGATGYTPATDGWAPHPRRSSDASNDSPQGTELRNENPYADSQSLLPRAVNSSLGSIDEVSSSKTKYGINAAETTAQPQPASLMVTKPASSLTTSAVDGHDIRTDTYAVTVKQNKAAKMCGLVGTSYNVEVTATHFRLLEPGSPIPIMGWMFHEMKSFILGKDCIIIDVGASPGVAAGSYVFKTKSSKEVFRAIQQSIQRQLWGQREERRATLERGRQLLARPLPSPLEDSQDDVECLLNSSEDSKGRALPLPDDGSSLDTNGIYRDASVGGASVSTGSTEDSRSLTDSIAEGITETPQSTGSIMTAPSTGIKMAPTAGVMAAQTPGAMAEPRSSAVDQVSMALTSMKASASRIAAAKGTTTKAVETSEDSRVQNSDVSKIFPVTLKQNKVTKLFGLTSAYNLEVAPAFVRLCGQTSSAPIMVWTLAELQSFSLGKESVEVIVGKASGIGAGSYVFKTKSNKELFRAIEQCIHRQLHEHRSNPPPPPLPPFKPREKMQPTQQTIPSFTKEASCAKTSDSSQDSGHKPTATENVYDVSPSHQQSGSFRSDGSGSETSSLQGVHQRIMAVPTTAETAKQTGGNVDSHDPPVCCGGQTSVSAENRDISKQHIHADEKLSRHHMDEPDSTNNVCTHVPVSPGTKTEMEQEIEICTVTLKQNKSAISSGLVGTYNLLITPTDMRLTEINQTVPVVVWTYQEIRAFSKSKNTFNLEVGRRAQTGAGEFVFNTKCAEEVFKVIEHHVGRQLHDETIGQDVRKRLITQPILHTEISNEKSDGTAGKYHPIDNTLLNKNKPEVENVKINTINTFIVTLKQNKSAVLSGLVGTYNLEITPTEVRLIEINQTIPVVVWTYQVIRAFSRDKNVFNFEVGRRAQTGAGEFVFNTQSAEELYKVIEHHVGRQLHDETIGRDVRNHLMTQPILLTEAPLDEKNTQDDALGKYHRIDIPVPPQEKPSIAQEDNVGQSGKYHHFDDSLPNEDGADSDVTMSNIWAKIDSEMNPYGEVLQHEVAQASSTMANEQPDLEALQRTVHKMKPDIAPLLTSMEGNFEAEITTTQPSTSTANEQPGIDALYSTVDKTKQDMTPLLTSMEPNVEAERMSSNSVYDVPRKVLEQMQLSATQPKTPMPNKFQIQQDIGASTQPSSSTANELQAQSGIDALHSTFDKAKDTTPLLTSMEGNFQIERAGSTQLFYFESDNTNTDFNLLPTTIVQPSVDISTLLSQLSTLDLSDVQANFTDTSALLKPQDEL